MAMSDDGRCVFGPFLGVHRAWYLARWGYKVKVRWFCMYTIVEGEEGSWLVVETVRGASAEYAAEAKEALSSDRQRFKEQASR
jgi:hypothetical protein